MLGVLLLVHVLFNHLWVVEGLSEYVIVYSRAILVRHQPRWKLVRRPKFLFILILMHESIDIVLINWRRHLELGLSWNYLMNCLFVIVCWLISHHIKTTLHALTWIALTHSYLPKKLITILLNILNIPFIVYRKDLIMRSLIIIIVRNFIVAFILIKLACLFTVN